MRRLGFNEDTHLNDHPNSPCRFLEDAVTHHGDEPAVITDGVSVNYAQLGARAAAVAHVIKGLPTDNMRVVLLAPNGAAYVSLYWGILLAGRTTVELNPNLGVTELETRIRGVDPLLVLDCRNPELRVVPPEQSKSSRALLVERLIDALEGFL